MESREIQEMVEGKVTDAIKANNRDLLRDIGSMIDKISGNNKSLKTVETPKFKRKSNEEQYKINDRVLSKLEEANQSLSTENIDKTKESIIEGNILL